MTVTSMIGANTSARFSVRRHEGGCGCRPGRRAAARDGGRLPRGHVLGVELVPLLVLPDVLVPLLLRAAAPLLARRHAAIMPGRSRRSARHGRPCARPGRPGGTRGAASRPRRRARGRRRSPARAALSVLRGERTCAAFTVHAASASSGARPSCVQASEQTSGRLSQNALPGVEVGRERDGCARVDEGPCRRHRPAEEERARRQEHARDVTRREQPRRPSAPWPRGGRPTGRRARSRAPIGTRAR